MSKILLPPIKKVAGRQCFQSCVSLCSEVTCDHCPLPEAPSQPAKMGKPRTGPYTRSNLFSWELLL